MNSTRVHPEPATSPILGESEEQLRALLSGMGEKPYRAGQILEWVYQRGATRFEDMTNLPRSLRARLAESHHVYESTIAAESAATDGTRKLLLRWADAQTTECVLIPDDDRRTACISTQVGCPVGCVFCASGLAGLQRNLTAAQIIEQALRVRGLCGPHRLTNVVFMGLGEPLANYDATLSALRTINSEKGLNVGARKITVSTVGLPKQMRQLADERLQITLALSLHAPTDALRAELIPWARGVTIEELTEAARYYFEKTGREVTLEYVLLGGVNDTLSHAIQVAALCSNMRANVNLIRYNPVPDLPYERPTSESAQSFLEALRARGVNAHLRRSRGLEIDGACGQLRRRHAGAEPKP
jgi:23S rRNA (adenine2503-C2)-methyltransferase